MVHRILFGYQSDQEDNASKNADLNVLNTRQIGDHRHQPIRSVKYPNFFFFQIRSSQIIDLLDVPCKVLLVINHNGDRSESHGLRKSQLGSSKDAEQSLII